MLLMLGVKIFEDIDMQLSKYLNVTLCVGNITTYQLKTFNQFKYINEKLVITEI